MRQKPVDPNTNTRVPPLTGDYGTDAAFWQLSEVLAEIAKKDDLKDSTAGELARLQSEISIGEIARNESASEAGQRESPTVNTEESATDEQSSA